MEEEKDSLMAKGVIEQTLTNWVNPELEKRKGAGEIGENFLFRAAQVLFSVGGAPVVRINSEVKAIVKAKVNRRIEEGETILDKDVDDIQSMSLLEGEKDFGHITIVKLSKGWFVGFSFIYDVSKSKVIYDIAIEYMSSAYADLQEKRYRPFIESLSIAAENLVKARIYLLPDKEIRKAKTHKTIQTKANIYARTDSIIRTGQKDTFNTLINLRDRARYDPSFSLQHKEASLMFDEMKKLSKEVFTYLVRFGEIVNGND